MNTFIIHKALLAAFFFTIQLGLVKSMDTSNPMITRITNLSENSVFIFLKDQNTFKWWNKEKQILIDIDAPVEIASGATISLTIPIPLLNEEYTLDRKSPPLHSDILSPALLGIKTSRKMAPKKRKAEPAEDKPYFQKAQFNIFLGLFCSDQGYSKSGVWSQKIVNDREVSQIAILCASKKADFLESPHNQAFELVVNEKGCPDLHYAKIENQIEKK